MATGKLLYDLTRSDLWKDEVESHPGYCSMQVFDQEGQPIPLELAKHKVMCHMRILFKKWKSEGKLYDVGKMELLRKRIRQEGSVPGESLCDNLFSCYGFTELVIS